MFDKLILMAKSAIQKVSIIVPSYNEETSLKVLLDELGYFLKDFKYNYEVIFVDDGSKDNSFNILTMKCYTFQSKQQAQVIK